MSVAAPIGQDLARSLIVNLGGDCQTGALVARTIMARTTGVFDARSLDAASSASLERIATDFLNRRWLVAEGPIWRAGAVPIPEGVPSFLEGAAAMLDILPIEGRATAAVTLPVAPSAIERALPLTGVNYAHLIDTDEALERVARAAQSQFTVMTPFLNEPGLTRALQMFAVSKAPTKRLILRTKGGSVDTARHAAAAIVAAGIEVYDYYLPNDSGYETFHAKVALADEALAYVGSVNMTVYARFSMELGVMMDGHPARIVASVVRAVERIATRVALRGATI